MCILKEEINNNDEHSLLSPRRSSNSLLNVRIILEDKWCTLEFPKFSLLECNPARPFLIIFIFFIVAIREKHGLLRDDFWIA